MHELFHQRFTRRGCRCEFRVRGAAVCGVQTFGDKGVGRDCWIVRGSEYFVVQS